MTDTAKFGAKQFFTPFSLSGLMRERELGADLKRQVLPFVGMTPASQQVMLSPAESLAQHFLDAGKPQSRSPEGGTQPHHERHLQVRAYGPE